MDDDRTIPQGCIYALKSSWTHHQLPTIQVAQKSRGFFRFCVLTVARAPLKHLHQPQNKRTRRQGEREQKQSFSSREVESWMTTGRTARMHHKHTRSKIHRMELLVPVRWNQGLVTGRSHRDVFTHTRSLKNRTHPQGASHALKFFNASPRAFFVSGRIGTEKQGF